MLADEQDVDPRQALAGLWQGLGGDPSLLADVELRGHDPVVPSSFRVGTAAQATIAAAGLAAAALWRLKTGRRQRLAVDMRHAAAEFRSERYLRIDGAGPGAAWDPLAGLYRTRDGYVRLHTNFAHHRDAVLRVLACAPTRDDVAAALSSRDAVAFESEAYAAGGVVAALRSMADWADHPQAAALAALPVVSIARIGEAPPRPLPPGPRPLSGVRVLELTRIIAGPVGGRTLAAHGADVMRIAAPDLPTIAWLDKDTGRGKLSTAADLATTEGCATLRSLVAGADVFIQGFRPGAIAAKGFAPDAVAALRPGIVYVSLSAYGEVGPWAERRGFDSLVQTASGFNDDEGKSLGAGRPKELPCQALDHASGHLIAFGAMMARKRQAEEGGSWLVRVSLARTGTWIRSLGRVDGRSVADPAFDDVADLTETTRSGFGPMTGIRHAAQLSETPAGWARPAMPLCSAAPEWPR